MSYDLFFARRDGGELPLEEFANYFDHRPRWEARGEQAWYANQDTGVYFSIDHGDEGESSDDDFRIVAAFNLNFFRPHYFGLEAAPEVQAFVEAFDLLVDDPQIDGAGRSPFSRDGMLSGWNHGNRQGYRILLDKPAEDYGARLMPTADLDRHWRWNLAREATQARWGERLFVPKVAFHLHEGTVRSTVVWTDGIPCLLPVVDTILIVRQELTPRGWLRRALSRGPDFACAPWQQAVELLSGFPIADDPCPHRVLEYTATPPAVASFVRGAASLPGKPEIVGNDHVLNAELAAEAASSR
jgi:hypothetical protein